MNTPDQSFSRDTRARTAPMSPNRTGWKGALALQAATVMWASSFLVVKDAVIIPLYWYTRLEVTKPYVQRTFSDMSGDDRWEKWDIKK